MSRNDTSTGPLEDGGRPHQPADDKEVTYFQGSPLLRGDLSRVAGFAFIGAILIAIPILLRAYKPELQPWWLWAVCIGLALVCLLIPYIIVKSTRYRISNYRIDYERGIFSKKIDTMELWHVDDVSFRQSLVDRILNTGDIIVLSDDDTTPKLNLDGIPNPRPLFESLKQRIIAVKRQRGVIKMDVG